MSFLQDGLSVRESYVCRALDRIYDSVVGACQKCDHGFVSEKPQGDSVESLISTSAKKCECYKTYEKIKAYVISGIPREFWAMAEHDLADFKIGDKEKEKLLLYLEKLKPVYEHGINLLFDNPEGIDKPNNGTGKTSIACKVLEHALLQGHTAHFTSMQNLFGLIFRTKGDKSDAEEYMRYIDEIEGVDFLCIDELGKMSTSEFVRYKFEDMIRTRSQKLLVTILVTNMSIEELRTNFGKSVLDILSNSVVVSLVGQSFRQMRFIDIKRKIRWTL